MKHWLAVCAVIFTQGSQSAAEAKNPIEVGSVRWSRDLEGAYEKSLQTARPVLVLFQEVPGCAGCQKFGRTVLTHPLLVEAIETEFIPVVVYNNQEGPDRQILRHFNEPAWNYQVIRFLNGQGKDIIPRKDRVWSIQAVAERMVAALRAVGRPVPNYLQAVAVEHRTTQHRESAFAMHCFWTGEMELGKINGVISTEAGWIEGREVTKVVYDKRKVSLQALADQAKNAKCALKVYVPENSPEPLRGFVADSLDRRYRPAQNSDQKKQIARWQAIHQVPGLTAMQKTKINAFAPTEMSKALAWLSPRQRQTLLNAEQKARASRSLP